MIVWGIEWQMAGVAGGNLSSFSGASDLFGIKEVNLEGF